MGLQAEGDVLIDVHAGEQGVVLEDEAQTPFLRQQAGQIPAEGGDGAGGRLFKARDGPQGGGFAAAGGPQEGEEFALLNLNVQIVDGRKVAVFDDDVL